MDIMLSVGQYEDKEWSFTISNFPDLNGFNLRSQIRDANGVLQGSMSCLVDNAAQFTLQISSTISGAILPGNYLFDVMASNIADGKNYFIIPVSNITIIDTVTEPA